MHPSETFANNPTFDQLVPLDTDDLGAVELVCGRTLEQFLRAGQSEIDAGLMFLTNPVRSEDRLGHLMLSDRGLSAMEEVFTSADFFEFAVQHVEAYVMPMLCLHTRFAVGPEQLADPFSDRERQALETVGDAHRPQLEEMAELWWERERYRQLLVGRDHPTHVDEAMTMVAEAEKWETPEHLIGRALDDIISLAARYLRALTGVDMVAGDEAAESGVFGSDDTR